MVCSAELPSHHVVAENMTELVNRSNMHFTSTISPNQDSDVKGGRLRKFNLDQYGDTVSKFNEAFSDDRDCSMVVTFKSLP